MDNLQTAGLSFSASSDSRKVARIIIDYLYGVVFLLCAFFYERKSSSVVSAVLILLYFIDLYRIDRVFVWKFAFVVFSSVSYLFGEFFCDLFPTYLSELGVITHYTGAFATLALYNWIFYTVLRLVDHRISKRMSFKKVNYSYGGKSVSNIVFKLGGIIIFLLGLGMFMTVARNPSFKIGLDRFAYRKEYLSQIIAKLIYYPSYLCPLIIIPILQNKKKLNSKIIIRVIAVYVPFILFLIWAGHKFGSFWTLLYSIAIPLVFAYTSNKNKRISIKSILFIVVLLLLFVVILILFYTLRGLSFEEAFAMLTWRVSAQGELWWKMFDLEKNAPIRLDAFFEEIRYVFKAVTSRGAVRQYGVYRLMEMFGNPSVVERAYEEGWRYSAGGFELPFYFFKYAAFIIVPLIVAPIYSLLSNSYIKSVLSGDFITGICFLHFIHVFHSAVLQGDWMEFLTLDSLFFLMVLILISLWKKYCSR